jgi:hypothetical protein
MAVWSGCLCQQLIPCPLRIVQDKGNELDISLFAGIAVRRPLPLRALQAERCSEHRCRSAALAGSLSRRDGSAVTDGGGCSGPREAPENRRLCRATFEIPLAKGRGVMPKL